MCAMNPRLLRPLASGFDPRTISGIAGWWDAADATTVTLNNTDPASPTVSELLDKSGLVRHAGQSNSSAQPKYLLAQQNGRNVLEFNGTSHFMRGPWEVTFTAQSTFAVVAMGSGSNWGRPFSQTTTSDGTATGTMNADFSISGHYIPILRNSTTQAFGSYNASAVRASVNFTYDAWGVWSSIHSGSLISNSLNGGTAATYATTTYNTTFDTFTLGSLASAAINQFMAGYWGEVLVYSRALSDAEAARVRAYLKQKWNTP